MTHIYTLITRLWLAVLRKRHTSGSSGHEYCQAGWLIRCSRVVITSDAFQSKMPPARHRMVYALLKDEMAQDGGIHALQLKTRTPEEEKRQLVRETQLQGSSTERANVESQ
jgi:stress-induced morphogen